MRRLFLLTSAAFLAAAPAAWAQTSADSRLHGSASGRYGTSEEVMAPGASLAYTPGMSGPGTFDPGSQRFIHPADPRYSLNDAPHRGQPSALEANGDDGGRGTSYSPLVSKESSSN
jgi:hypothetical protein